MNAKAAALAVLCVLGCGGAAEVPPPPPVVVEPAPDAALPPPPSAGGARAHLAAGDDDLPGGPAATGRPGDIVLANEHLVAVIGAPRPGLTPGRAGALLDIAPRGGADALGEMLTVLDDAGRRTVRFDKVFVERDGVAGGPAVVRAVGVDRLDDQLGVEVEYVLDSEARHVRLRTTLHQRGRSHHPDLVLGRLFVWGGLEPFVPGAGPSGAPGAAETAASRPLPGRRLRSDWVGADAEGASLAFAPVGGRVESIHARSWSLVVERREGVRPGSRVTREAQLFVDGGGGVAAAAGALHEARGTVVGRVEGRVVDPAGAPVSDGRVTWLDAAGAPAQRARTDAEGRFAARLPAGNYRAVAEAPGRAPSPAAPVRVGADDDRAQVLGVGRASALVAALRDEKGRPVAARLTVQPAGGGEARTLLAPAGSGRWPLAPGRWSVRATAGPDRGRARGIVRVPDGGEATFTATLAREVDRTGWLAVDPHVRTRLSGTSATTLAARLTACATEDLDAIVVADDGAIDPAPTAGSAVQVWPGVAVEAAGGGRFAVFPVDAPVELPADPRPDAVLAALRTLPGRPTIAVLRPRAEATGYFAAYAFDARAPALPRGGFSLDVDLLQVAVPWARAEAERAFADYVALLDAGRDVVPFGATGADALADPPCGLARTLVRAAPGAGPSALRDGEVVVSHGPLIELRVDGVGPGGRAPPRDAHDVRVRVRASSWRRPSFLEVVVDGEPWRRVPLPAGEGPLDAEHRLIVPGGSARWLLVRVDGAEGDDGIAPSAFTRAVRLGPTVPSVDSGNP